MGDTTITAEMQEQIDAAVRAAIEAMGLNKADSKMVHGDDDGDAKSTGWTGGDPAWKDDPKGGFKSFGEFLTAVIRADTGGLVDARLKATGLGESVPADGGFLVAQEFINEILKRTYETGILASRCRRIPVGANANGIKIPAISETSRADGSRWGGVQAYWAAEAGTKTASTPQFRQISMELKKLIGLCYATDELLQDATALESIIMQAFSEEFGFKIDDALVRGDGAGKPLGVLNAPCLVTVAKEAAQDADTIATENILKMWRRLWAPSRPNSVWFINQDIETELELLTVAIGTGGVLAKLYDPPGSPTNNTPYGKIKGRPVMPIEQCSTLGDKGDIILADFSQYLLIDKGQMQNATSIHVKFVNDETAFRFVYRLDGQPMWNSALTPYKGSDTLSPFVTLAERA
jgi:HK97 family phage major capsid protein